MTSPRRARGVGLPAALCLSCLTLVGCTQPAPATSEAGSLAAPTPQKAESKPTDRLFSAQDLGLLDAADRDQWQKPDQIMDALKIAEGSRVAELGAGGGWFTSRLARRVEENGIVYAEDIQRLMLVALERRREREGLRNVRPIIGTANDPKLPSGIDAVLIVDAYHEMQDPDDPTQVITLLKNVARSLKPQGCLGVVDFIPGGGGPGPDHMRVDPEAIVRAAEAAGLRLVKRESVPPFQFLLVFGKASTTSRCAS